MLLLHNLHFGLRIKVMDPSLSLGHNSMHKFFRIIIIERQGILRSIKHALLISGQHSGDQRQTAVPKLMPICLAILCRIFLHDQTVHKLNVFVCSSLFRVSKTVHNPSRFPSFSLIQQPISSQCCKKETHPK